MKQILIILCLAIVFPIKALTKSETQTDQIQNEIQRLESLIKAGILNKTKNNKLEVNDEYVQFLKENGIIDEEEIQLASDCFEYTD